MAVYKDKERNTWFVKLTYKEWDGKIKYVTKRGFQLKREAEDWEKDYLLKMNGDTGMLFRDFIDIYKTEHLARIRQSTADIKSSIIDNYLVPFFGDMYLDKITTSDIILWQNGLIKMDNGKVLSQSYLATIHSVLSAVLNYACKHYNLASNPASKAGSIGSLKRTKDDFWTADQYDSFIEALRKEDPTYYPFEILYWTGIRTGELLALNAEDYDPVHETLMISKTLHKTKGEIITYPPKTPDGYRSVKLPHSLAIEIKEYINFNGIEPQSPLFTCTKRQLRVAMDNATKKANLPRIRLHDLRHSHISLLLKLHYSPVAIGERMGHSSAYVTLRYAHVSPETQKQMAESLNGCMT